MLALAHEGSARVRYGGTLKVVAGAGLLPVDCEEEFLAFSGSVGGEAWLAAQINLSAVRSWPVTSVWGDGWGRNWRDGAVLFWGRLKESAGRPKSGTNWPLGRRGSPEFRPAKLGAVSRNGAWCPAAVAVARPRAYNGRRVGSTALGR